MNATALRVRRVFKRGDSSDKIVVDLKVDGVWVEVVNSFVDGPPLVEVDLTKRLGAGLGGSTGSSGCANGNCPSRSVRRGFFR